MQQPDATTSMEARKAFDPAALASGEVSAAGKSVTRTLRLKVKKNSYAWLNAAAIEVNQVWNWGAEISAKAARPCTGSAK